MKKMYCCLFLLIFCSPTLAQALIDADVVAATVIPLRLTASLNSQTAAKSTMPIIIFAKSHTQIPALLHQLNKQPHVSAQALHFMPAITAVIPKNKSLLKAIAAEPVVAQISLNRPGTEELEISAQALMLRSSITYPKVNNWWQAGYTGQSGVVGIIDSGVAVEHPGLAGKTIILNDADSTYSNNTNGVRSAHGTGVACIYAGMGSDAFPHDVGIAYGATTILSGFAMEHTDKEDNAKEDRISLTTTVDWMLSRAPQKPTIINYSFGNGDVSCADCMDWGGLAKIVDYVVNHEKILWVKSSGNKGFIKPGAHAMLSAPADNYNALTVANMNPTIIENGVTYQTPDRSRHTIAYRSSRGPTLKGRRKPDITAIGNDTRTCAPDATVYPFKYTPKMDYRDGYRLMGGTSAATPHVGAAVLLLQDAGIKHPMAAKALLINSADAWTDSGVAGPNDPEHPYAGGHFPVMGSEWNPTYGWGYMNMQQAFDQRTHIYEESLTLNTPIKEYKITLPVGGKVTLIHERRVGFNPDGSEWRFSHLKLELYDADTQALITQDDSPIDTVHQIANCLKTGSDKQCSDKTKTIHAMVRLTLVSTAIDGSDDEPYALVYG
ncbi:MAG: S8 family peptidase [Gammaproteobacteria bacterium]|nr:S8 family peptidase [Gammaproteobacteria bacterium]